MGYVALPAFGGIVAASALCAPFGVRIAHRVSPVTRRRLFAGLLVVFGARLLFG